MAKRQKEAPTDGLGPRERKQIHKAVRQVWSWSHSRRLAVKRATGKDGFPRCEECGQRVPKVQVDHIRPVGEVGGPRYIQKMFVPSTELKCLCKTCHKPKTDAENRARRKARIKDFY